VKEIEEADKQWDGKKVLVKALVNDGVVQRRRMRDALGQTE
jgi:hypothetical protein